MGGKRGNSGIFGMILHLIPRLILLLILALAGLIVAYRFINPVSTLMLARMALGERVTQHFVPLEAISPALRAAVIVSEDGQFCRHHGVDWGAMREVVDEAGIGGPSRGASTITMQVVKNLFLWQGHSYLRKGLEIPLALVLDRVWPKRRILEVYLNIAEWGDGIFGAEAAAETYFDTSAGNLDPHQAALLAAVLPDPHRRHVLRPNRHVAIHARVVERRMGTMSSLLSCVR